MPRAFLITNKRYKTNWMLFQSKENVEYCPQTHLVRVTLEKGMNDFFKFIVASYQLCIFII